MSIRTRAQLPSLAFENSKGDVGGSRKDHIYKVRNAHPFSSIWQRPLPAPLTQIRHNRVLEIQLKLEALHYQNRNLYSRNCSNLKAVELSLETLRVALMIWVAVLELVRGAL